MASKIVIPLGVLAIGAIACEMACGTGDHVPSQAEIKASHDTRLKNFDKMVNLPEPQKRTIEALMGGRPYQNPAIAAAMAKARANGAKLPGGARPPVAP